MGKKILFYLSALREGKDENNWDDDVPFCQSKRNELRLPVECNEAPGRTLTLPP